ncbi:MULTISPECIES: NusG domain II-containing protein [unclassified Enterococcus]|uniref:NusG domain II-containing protein n=1 Tax=unclassified Enterococcus TaxID=2608891 RepID=UPI00155438CD|nr:MULTISPECIES: NusG domain II-containing protein [unclassified Enterococcus]MBS7577188.1 NusG domain II-containing protein [Enterococcus sp. MMGLQ5-2]MBS7584719.1 NusG domain II-containing protein [Enterococcus sp. MMGLQ5-1]NPD12574.1 NusG domain II-containing protein [Enterococcus sp. MMGLQ5-1]NPD37022.1 NusG domain II-containing protein [Enterococcus sp. MMGLQ5-2]
MKKISKYLNLKPFDFLIVSILVIGSFLPLFILRNTNSAGNEVWAELRVDGKLIKKFDLSQNEASNYRYVADDGDYNLIEVKNQQIRIKEANCGDQICIKRGWIKKSGETIVCLPHKLVIEIKNNAETNDGEVVY